MSVVAVAIVGTAAVGGALNASQTNRAARNANNAQMAAGNAANEALAYGRDATIAALNPFVGLYNNNIQNLQNNFQSQASNGANAVNTDRAYGGYAQQRADQNGANLASQYNNILQNQANDARTENYAAGDQENLYYDAGGAARQNRNFGNQTQSNLTSQLNGLNTAGNTALGGLQNANQAWNGVNNGLSAANSNWSGANAGTNQQIGQLGAGINTLAGQQGALNVNEFLDPSIKFAQQQGMEAVQSGAAARGLLNSGAAVKSAMKLGAGLGLQNFNQATQNAIASRNQQIGIGNTQANIGNTGVGNAAQLATTGLNTGSNIAQQGLTTGANLYGQGAGLNAQLYGQQAGINNQQYLQGVQNNYNGAQAGADRAQQLYLNGAQLDANRATNQAALNANQYNTGLQGLSGLTQIGINAAQGIGQAQADYGLSLAGLNMGQGASNAAAAAAQRNPVASGISSGLNAFGGLAAAYSDPALKEEVEKVTDKDIDEFLAMSEAKSYNYTDRGQSKGAPAGRQTGVMADKIERTKIGKPLITYDEEGYRMVDTNKAVGAMMASMGNIHARIKKIEGKK